MIFSTDSWREKTHLTKETPSTLVLGTIQICQQNKREDSPGARWDWVRAALFNRNRMQATYEILKFL